MNRDRIEFQKTVEDKLKIDYGIDATALNTERAGWLKGVTWLAFFDPSPSVARTIYIAALAIQQGSM